MNNACLLDVGLYKQMFQKMPESIMEAFLSW